MVTMDASRWINFNAVEKYHSTDHLALLIFFCSSFSTKKIEKNKFSSHTQHFSIAEKIHEMVDTLVFYN